MEHFVTERLIARDWAESDDEAAFAIYGQDEVSRWLGAPPQTVGSLAEMRQRLAKIIERGAANPGSGYGRWSCATAGR